MNSIELTKEEMSEYLKVENFLKKYKREINFLYSLNTLDFGQFGKYSAIYKNARNTIKDQEVETSGEISMAISFITAATSFIIFKGNLSIVIAIACLTCVISFFTISSILAKASMSDYWNVTKRLSNFTKACSEARIFHTKDYIINNLSPSDKDLYNRIDTFLTLVKKYGYYNKYLSSEGKARKENIEQEKIKAHEKLNRAKEPIEKEYWESRVKAIEEEVKSFQR